MISQDAQTFCLKLQKYTNCKTFWGFPERVTTFTTSVNRFSCFVLWNTCTSNWERGEDEVNPLLLFQQTFDRSSLQFEHQIQRSDGAHNRVFWWKRDFTLIAPATTPAMLPREKWNEKWCKMSSACSQIIFAWSKDSLSVTRHKDLNMIFFQDGTDLQKDCLRP